MSSEESGPAPGRFRTIASRSAPRTGEGSIRGILNGFSRTNDRPSNGPPMREMCTTYYLQEEMRSARQAVQQLDVVASKAVSFREAASKLREEAHRAMGRLETAVAQIADSESVDPDLIGVACDITCAAKRGITLVDVHGKYSTVVKIFTLFLRSYIHSKFEKQTELLKKLQPPLPPGMSRRSQVPMPQIHAVQPQQHAGGYAPCSNAVQSVATGVAGATGQYVIPEGQVQLVRSSGGLGVGPQAGPTSAAPVGPALPQPPPQATQPLVSTVLPSNRHEKVLAILYVPATQVQASEYVCIWWSVGQRLEFYSEATQSTTAFQESSSVTALGIDGNGSIWTGHSKGQVRVRYKQQWERTVEDKAFTTAIKAIAFDERGRAWTGDESGRMKVLSYEPDAGQLHTVASLQRSPALWAKMKGTANLFGKRHCNTSGTSGQTSAAAVFAAASAATAAGAATAREGSPGGVATGGVNVAAGGTTAVGGNVAGGTNQAPPGGMEGPVRCIFVRGGRAWASGGRSCAWLQLWDVDTLQDLDVYECGSLGPCHAIATLRWPSASSAGSSLHVGVGSQHRHTHSDGLRAGLSPVTGSSTGGQASGFHGCPWRLLTGHDNGQLLLWHPEHRNLAPLLRIGDPGSPCRGIAAFEAFNLVVTGHQSGHLHLFRQPAAESALPPGADSASPQSLGTYRPKMVSVSAHKSRLDRMAYSATSCVTASILGTIRMWHAADLAAEAQRLGLVFTQHTASYGSLQGAETCQTSTYSVTIAQCGRDSAKALNSEGTPHASSLFGSATLATATCSMSNTLSGTLQQPSSVGTIAAGGTGAYQHTRQSSKDSMDTAGGTQPGSGNTFGMGPSTTDVPGSLIYSGPVTSAASVQHFQTIDYSELQEKKKIGSGAYGEVLLAEWTGSEVAVKKLFAVQNMDDKEYSTLMNEVTLLGSLNHPNIARFLAMCVDPPCIVMQYYPHGSLFDLLNRANKGSPKAAKELTWSKRLDMLRDVASGMHYLHSRKPPVIHGDLRSPNLLLDLTIDRERPRFHVRIADFGLARMATGTTGSVMVSKTTNPRWLAPEVIKNSSVGKAADVYSFSIIMWEMLTWRQPYHDMMSVQVMFATVNDNSRPEVPPDAQLPGGPGPSLPLYLQLMESCWQADAAQRPSFKDIVDVLQGMQRVETDSPRPQRPQQQQQQHEPPVQTPNTVQGPPSPIAQAQQQAQQKQSPGLDDRIDPNGRGSGNGNGSGGAAAEGSTTAAGESLSAPAAGGSCIPAAPAAAVVAAARRTISTGIMSPFMCTTALTAPGEVQVDDQNSLTPQDGGHTSLGVKQYGSVLALYGMSPILEETASVMTPGSQTATDRSAAQSATAGGLTPLTAEATATAPPVALPSLQQPQHHPHHASHPHSSHVHFAPASPFVQTAVGAAAAPGRVVASASCPASPMPRASTAAMGSSSSRGFPRQNHNHLSSASSTESGFVHAVSGGSNIAGAPSTAESSRQSSTSTSGRTLGAAAAAAAATAAAASGNCHRTGAAPAVSAAVARQGGPGINTDRRAVAGAVTASVESTKSALMETDDTVGSALRTAAGSVKAPESSGAALWPSYSTPMVVTKSITALSPFASIPASQIGELDAAAPQLAAVVRQHHLGTASGAATTLPSAHASRPAAPLSPRNASMSRGGGGGGGDGGGGGGGGTLHAASSGRGAAGSTERNSIYVGVGQAATPATSSIRGRQVNLGVATRHGGASGSTPSATPRSGGGGGGGGSCQSQPGTPPHTGAATAFSASRGSTGYGSRQSSITGSAPALSSGNAQASKSRRRSGSIIGDAVPRSVAVSSHMSMLAGRLSHSAAHSHDDGHDDNPAGLSGRPGHRRTPSGGSVGNQAGTVAAGRGRDVEVLMHEGSSAAHPRTPPYVTRPGSLLGSPRPPAAESRSLHAVRRSLVGAPSAHANGVFDISSSTSAPSFGHLSRLAAAARPPGSPRSYIPGGPGYTYTHHHGGVPAGGGGVSRIPSLAQAITQASGQPQPVKSTTSRSLDDGNLRRYGLCNQASSSPPRDPAAASPTTTVMRSDVAAPQICPSEPPDAGWEEGLDGVRRSPEVTKEVPLDTGKDDGEDVQRIAKPLGSSVTANQPCAVPPLMQKIVTSGLPSTRGADGVWQLSPQVAAAAGGANSPFATAAYASPFFSEDGEEAVGEAEGPSGGVHSLRGSADVSDNRAGSGLPMAATSPSPGRSQDMENGDSSWVAPVATVASLALTAPETLVRVSAAPKSPFAQAAGQDAWWESSHQPDID